MRRRPEERRSSRSQPCCLRIESLERKSCPAAMLAISLAEPVVLEGEKVTCYVALTEPARVTERVYLTMANGTATYGSDYFAPTSQQVTFGPGQSQKIVTFSTLRDAGSDRAEGIETFQIVATPVTESLGTRAVTAMIADYVPLPAISIADTTVIEGSTGTTATASLTVSLASWYPKPVTVNYVTRDGSATVAASDYVAAAGLVTFAPYERTKTVSITVNGDSTLEPDETFQIFLAGPINGRLARNAATVTIKNDEIDAPGFQITLNYTNPSLPASQKRVFERAVSRVQQIIVGDLPGVTMADGTFIDDIRITASVEAMDPGLNGFATATAYRPGTAGLPFDGEIHLNAARISNPGIYYTAIHEMLHALGFASDFFSAKNTVSGLGTTNPLFTGANAVRWYKSYFGLSSAPGVPLYGVISEVGSYGSHWDSNTIGTEIMSVGWDTTSTVIRPFSGMTIGALQDLGYQVNYSAADFYTRPADAAQLQSGPAILARKSSTNRVEPNTNSAISAANPVAASTLAISSPTTESMQTVKISTAVLSNIPSTIVRKTPFGASLSNAMLIDTKN